MDNPNNQSQLPATGYELHEDNFKADTQACDRYISFSSELLRLSLIGIGAYGTLVTYFLEHSDANLAAFKCDKSLFASAVLFAACAGATLFHRFWASDSMAYYVAYLRALLYKKGELKVNQEWNGLRKMLRRAEITLIIAEFLFGLAVIMFIIGIYQLL